MLSKYIVILCILLISGTCINMGIISQQKKKLSTSTNYTTNITTTEFKYIESAITAVERKFGSDQYNQIAQAVSAYMKKSQGFYWNVFVFGSWVTNLGIQLFAQLNKTAVLFETGIYKLGFVFMQTVSHSYNWTTILATNQTELSEKYGNHTSDSQISLIRAAVSSAAVYAGDDAQKTANFLFNKMKNGGTQHQWNVIVSSPVLNGAYCNNDLVWGVLTKYADLKWNYYFWNSP